MVNLTVKQEKACQKYIELGDKSAAYRYAYNCSQMKPESVNRKAHEFFEQVKIRSRVEQLQRELKQRNDISNNTLIQELKGILFFNPKDLFDQEGKLKDISQLPNYISANISSIDIVEEKTGKRSIKLKFYSKLAAMEKLAKHIGFYEKEAKSDQYEKTVIIIPDNGR
ncbi:terminase small subunit [Marinifilum flexuosum]|uniref:terminase small subunit n=1 Tax=Marinifilum flexuosum TaxID=1117708 RepID=UPI0024908729|nr:terminase small subunit [Marinifilum flexuosum]